ncbi:unnamed protein product [Musa textilis]
MIDFIVSVKWRETETHDNTKFRCQRHKGSFVKFMLTITLIQWEAVTGADSVSVKTQTTQIGSISITIHAYRIRCFLAVFCFLFLDIIANLPFIFYIFTLFTMVSFQRCVL